jgi:Flp pilus assembly pilin Flp
MTVNINTSQAKAQRQRGQGMTEYIIIVALIAVAAIAAFQFFGQTIRSQTSGIAHEVAGQNAQAAISAAQTAAANTDAERNRKGLGNYNNANGQ